MQSWYEENRIGWDKVPPHDPDCEAVFRGSAPVIQSPRSGTEYLISTQDPEPLQLSARCSNDVSRIYWYVNNRFYRSAAPGEKIFFMPPEGSVKISCSDDRGRNRDVRIRVRLVNL
jgi:penicillin-binding protein 1C